RKTVRFVARALQQTQAGVRAREPQRLGAAYKVDFLLALGQTDKCYVTCTRLGCGGDRCTELTFAAVDDCELGQRQLFLETSVEITRDNFMHRAEIVVAPFTANAEPTILGFVRFGIAKDNGTPDQLTALCVRDVKADNQTRYNL